MISRSDGEDLSSINSSASFKHAELEGQGPSDVHRSLINS